MYGTIHISGGTGLQQVGTKTNGQGYVWVPYIPIMVEEFDFMIDKLKKRKLKFKKIMKLVDDEELNKDES